MDRCDTCKNSRVMNNLRVRCLETGEILSAFTEACSLYDCHASKHNRGWGVIKKLMGGV